MGATRPETAEKCPTRDASEKRCSFYFVEAQHSVKHLKFLI